MTFYSSISLFTGSFVHMLTSPDMAGMMWMPMSDVDLSKCVLSELRKCFKEWESTVMDTILHWLIVMRFIYITAICFYRKYIILSLSPSMKCLTI